MPAMPVPASLPCPTCGQPVPLAPGERPDSFPFCCGRCRLRDLGAWADGRHVVPGKPLTGWEDDLP